MIHDKDSHKKGVRCNTAPVCVKLLFFVIIRKEEKLV